MTIKYKLLYDAKKCEIKARVYRHFVKTRDASGVKWDKLTSNQIDDLRHDLIALLNIETADLDINKPETYNK